MVATIPLPPDVFRARLVAYCAAWREPRPPGVRSGGRVHCSVELGVDGRFELITDRSASQHVSYFDEGSFLRPQFNCHGRIKTGPSGTEVHAEAVLAPYTKALLGAVWGFLVIFVIASSVPAVVVLISTGIAAVCTAMYLGSHEPDAEREFRELLMAAAAYTESATDLGHRGTAL